MILYQRFATSVPEMRYGRSEANWLIMQRKKQGRVQGREQCCEKTAKRIRHL
jgi:hypothetical protein